MAVVESVIFNCTMEAFQCSFQCSVLKYIIIAITPQSYSDLPVAVGDIWKIGFIVRTYLLMSDVREYLFQCDIHDLQTYTLLLLLSVITVLSVICC